MGYIYTKKCVSGFLKLSLTGHVFLFSKFDKPRIVSGP